MEYTAVLVAAGSGTRMNLGYNKILYEIEPNVRVIDKSIHLFNQDKRCKEVIVVLSENDIDIVLNNVTKTIGGTTRCESVYNGVKLVKTDYVVIHDGARPFLTYPCLNRLVDELEKEDACFLAISERDTLKTVEDGYVTGTIDRSKVWHAQTPQAFKTKLIKECLEKAISDNAKVTDDVSCVELYSDTKVKVVEGDPNNIKLTVKEDLNIVK